MNLFQVYIFPTVKNNILFENIYNLKRQQREMDFWLNLSHIVQLERIFKKLKFVLLLTKIYTLLCLLAYQENMPRASLRHLHVCINPFRVFSEYVYILSAHMETILCTANNPNLPYSPSTLKYFLRILCICLDTFRAVSVGA